MPLRVLSHLRHNVVAYLALFTALAGTSYAAVRLTPGSVTSPALANRAVTHAKLGVNSVTSANVKPRSLVASDFASGALSSVGRKGEKGDTGDAGPTGPAGGATTTLRSHGSGAVTAAHGATTPVPLANTTWTQAANELNLLAGAMTVSIPSSCSGSPGALVLSVDGTPATVGFAPTNPASKTVTLPFNVGTVTETSAAASHTLSAAFTNSCTGDGQDFGVSDVKVNVIRVP